MKRLQEKLCEALTMILEEEGISVRVRVEFSRRDHSAFSCASIASLQGRAPDTLIAVQNRWNEHFSALARAQADGSYLNLYPTEAALREETEILSRIGAPEEPEWTDDGCAARIHRLRADLIFGIDAPFRADSAMALLRLERRLPYPPELLRSPLHPLINLALQNVLQQERKLP